MIITIDGPAGSGKSSLSKQLAKALNFDVLDTGAMYRSVAYLSTYFNLNLDSPEFESFLNDFSVIFQQGKVIANGIDVTTLIRTPEIDFKTSNQVSVNPLVRSKMTELQRKSALNTNIVAEGRDMGSAVFPHAELKLYLDARVDVRAKRRALELKEKGIDKPISELEEEIKKRDYDDSHRELNPLIVPKDAVIIDTSDLSPEEVLQKMIDLYEQSQK